MSEQVAAGSALEVQSGETIHVDVELITSEAPLSVRRGDTFEIDLETPQASRENCSMSHQTEC